MTTLTVSDQIKTGTATDHAEEWRNRVMADCESIAGPASESILSLAKNIEARQRIKTILGY